MSGRPARRGPESSSNSAQAKPLPSRRSERRRNPSCGFTEITLLVVACILAGALFRLVPHASIYPMTNELGPLPEGRVTTATPTWASPPSQALDGLSDAQLAELVLTQNATLSKLTEIVHTLKSNAGVDLGSDSTRLPVYGSTAEHDKRVAAVASSAALAAKSDLSQVRISRLRSHVSSNNKASFRHPKGPPRVEPQLPSAASFENSGAPRVVHGINLVPPTHGLHADQVMMYL